MVKFHLILELISLVYKGVELNSAFDQRPAPEVGRPEAKICSYDLSFISLPFSEDDTEFHRYLLLHPLMLKQEISPHSARERIFWLK